MEIAAEYTERREGFGVTLADRGSVQIKMGGIAHDIQVGRLLVMHAAWKLDQGAFARKEISSAKIHVANTLHTAVDTAIQFNGARGYFKDTVLEWISGSGDAKDIFVPLTVGGGIRSVDDVYEAISSVWS